MMNPQGPLSGTEQRPAGQTSSGGFANVKAPDAGSDQRNGPRTASVHTLHAFGRKGEQTEPRPPSLVRRTLRSVIRLVVTLLIGIGGTLAWQSYGETVRTIAAVQAPTLARLLPPTGSPAPAPPTQQPAAYNLETLRLNIEQLAARQDQMAQSFAALLAVELDIRQKLAFTPASAMPIPAAPVQSYKPAQPRPRPLVAQ